MNRMAYGFVRYMKKILYIYLVVSVLAVMTLKAWTDPLVDGPIKELKGSISNIDRDWLFKLDADDIGIRDKWFSLDHIDTGWNLIQTGASWEEQGYRGYDGLGWYRKWVDVPVEWKNSRINLVADGVDDEYDLYVLGRMAVERMGRELRKSVPANVEKGAGLFATAVDGDAMAHPRV